MAKLAGICDAVVNRAKEILRQTESPDKATSAARPAATTDTSGQLSLLADQDNPIIQHLKELDINVMTPIEALQELYQLVKDASAY